MARKVEATLWMLIRIRERSVMKRMVKQGRSYVPRIEGPFKPGSLYLRYTQNGRRIWEAVGSDLTLALQEQKARQRALDKPAAPDAEITPPKRILRDLVGEFLASKQNRDSRHILHVFGQWWGWTKDPATFHRPEFRAFGKYVASLGLRPRTEYNYLSHVCTFLRATGRVVEVANNEQSATLKRAMAVVPNTLVLVSSDFPAVNRSTPDYYSDDQIDALFANASNLWERLMLSCFYYTGVREAEASHLYWTDVRWEVSEIRVREKPDWQWTTKTFQDRDIEAPLQLMEVLREAYQLRDPNVRLIFPNALGRPEGHFLDSLQKIAYRAKITCGECPNCIDHKGRNCHEFGLHKFRRNYARQLDRGKTPIKDIKLALGHRDISTTDGYLGGGDKKQRREYVERSFPTKPIKIVA
jgi:integrase/recombinase XerD